MKISLINNTSKSLLLRIDDLEFTLKENSTIFTDVDSISKISIQGVNDNKSVKNRLKNELDFSKSEIRLRGGGFSKIRGVYNSYYAKEYIVEPTSNKASIEIRENTAIESKFLNAYSYSINSSGLRIIDEKLKYIDIQHKRVTKLSLYLILFVRYGILGLLGIIQTAAMLLTENLFDDTLLAIIAFSLSIAFDIFLVLYIVNFIKLKKLLKRAIK